MPLWRFAAAAGAVVSAMLFAGPEPELTFRPALGKYASAVTYAGTVPRPPLDEVGAWVSADPTLGNEPKWAAG